MIRPVRILCVADEVDLLVYSVQICERFSDVDLILSAGDLPDGYLEYIASMLNKPLISVAGNHDKSKQDIENAGIHYPRNQMANFGQISFRIEKESGISILGLPGSIRYNKG